MEPRLTERMYSIQGGIGSGGNSVSQRERFNAAAIVIGRIYSRQKNATSRRKLSDYVYVSQPVS